MFGFGRKGHPRKHDIASAIDHKGDIYDALVGALNALTAANVAVDKKTLDDAISAAIVGMQWQPPIIRFEAMVTNEPVAPSDGDRYISTEAGTIPSTTQTVAIDDVCEWDSGTSLWIITTPQDGWAVIEQGVDPNIAWWYSGTQWRKLGTIVDHANLLNLNWSVAKHIIDIDVDFGGYKATDCAGVEGTVTDTEIESTIGDVILKALNDVKVDNLTASQIVESGASKELVSVAKGDAYNKSFGTGSGDVCEGNDSRLPTASEKTEIGRLQPDVALAGVAPVDADVSGWSDGDRGQGIGTGGREFYMVKRGTAVKYVELS